MILYCERCQIIPISVVLLPSYLPRGLNLLLFPPPLVNSSQVSCAAGPRRSSTNMRAAPSHISTNYDITLRFIVENLRDFFEPVDHTEDSLVTVQQPAKLRTESFGPGLYIECRAEKTGDGVPCMSCRLFAGPTPYSGPITWFVSGVSLRGDTQYFQYSLTHTFGQGLGIGWREALSKVTHWDQSDTLREENALPYGKRVAYIGC